MVSHLLGVCFKNIYFRSEIVTRIKNINHLVDFLIVIITLDLLPNISPKIYSNEKKSHIDIDFSAFWNII